MKSKERRERKPNRERFICKKENLRKERKDNLRGKVRIRFFERKKIGRNGRKMQSEEG